MDFQQEVRQKLDELNSRQQETALTVQDIRARQTPPERLEAMLATRVSMDAYTAFKAETSQRLDRLERAPEASAAARRANISIAVAVGIGVITLLAPHFHW